MNVTVVPIVVGVLETDPKGMENKLEELEVRGRTENIQTIALRKSARILKI